MIVIDVGLSLHHLWQLMIAKDFGLPSVAQKSLVAKGVHRVVYHWWPMSTIYDPCLPSVASHQWACVWPSMTTYLTIKSSFFLSLNNGIFHFRTSVVLTSLRRWCRALQCGNRFDTFIHIISLSNITLKLY